MIISHSRKFIFVKTYKTAGSSLEIALSKYCAKGDVLTPVDSEEEDKLSGLGAQNYGKRARGYRAEDVVWLLRTRRYEHLEAVLAAVSARLGFERNVHDDMKAISAKKGIRPKAAGPSARPSAAGRQMVGLLCAPEIAMLGYTADSYAEDRRAPPPPAAELRALGAAALYSG